MPSRSERSAGSMPQTRPAERCERSRASISRERRRRPVGGKHHAAAILHQRVQGVEELDLARLLAADEVDVVDQQQVGRAQLVLEGRRLRSISARTKLDRNRSAVR